MEATFQAPIHRYFVDGEQHYANSVEPSIPAALADVISAIRGLDDFRLKPHLRKRAVQPNYNDGRGSHFLAPDDLSAIYDLSSLYSAGIDGTGQKLAVVGQTDVVLSDIAAFRSIFNFPANTPQLVLFGRDPGLHSSDQQEADLDLEWSGAIARNATLFYVYSTAVVSSLQYAVDQNLAPVISMSYGGCESQNQSVLQTYRTVAQQAASQGISWLASSGDTGAAGCDSGTTASHGPAVNFPASIPEVTAVGGTEFTEGSGSYWNSTNGPNQGSALGFIPEMAWNDTSFAGSLSATGGGVSIFFTAPSYHTGSGFPNTGFRDVPDVSLTASADHDGYIVCLQTTACPAATWKTLGEGSGYAVFGGTSASVQVFGGMLALVNHYLVSKGFQSTPGLGSANPTLYWLAKNNPSAFHDVTTGNNIVPCRSGSTGCSSGSFGFSAGAGYDQATGLGSIDAFNLAVAWGATVAPQISSISPATPATSASSQTLTVSGSGFQSGLTLTVISPSGTPTTVSSTNLSSTSFQAAVTLNATGAWKMLAVDADGRLSNTFSFNVGAQAGPSVTSSSATSVTSTTGTLNGTANPNALTTQAWFLYGTSSNLAGATATAQQGIGSGTTAVAVSASLTGLIPGTTYFYQTVASNSVGTTKSSILSFTTGSTKLPVTTTGAASSVTISSASASGSVNPNGLDTRFWFELSTSSAMTNSISTTQQDIGSGSSLVAVSATFSGLTANTTYYFQVWASNSAGTSQGAVVSFRTAQPPAVNTLPVPSFTNTTAIVSSSVNPEGMDTAAWFAYSTNSAMSGATTTAQQDIGAGSTTVTVNATLTGLTSSTTYYFQAFASNSAGVSQGSILSFTTSSLTLPSAPTPLNPANGASGIASAPTLSWSPAANATGYTVYFGSTNPPASSVALSGGNSTSYSPGIVSGLITYYWQVVATNSAGTASSPVVSFTTGPLAMMSTKVGVFRNNTAVLEDTNGNGVYDPGVDRFIPNFSGPGGFVAGDIPVTGDWTGDGHAKVGIYRSSTGTWYLDANNNGVFDDGDLTYQYGGLTGDLPFVGNWNSVQGISGPKDCVGIYRPQGSVWLLDLNCNGSYEGTPNDAFFPFGGIPGDVPVVGNWTGSTTRVGVVRKYAPGGVPQGQPFFWVYDSADANAGSAATTHQPAPNPFAFGGLAGDVFITGDWNNTGIAKAGVFRGAAGVQPFEWVLDANGRHAPDLVFNLYGVQGDTAITGKW